MTKDYSEDRAHIVYASDDKFAEILGVSLVSLYENSRDMQEICVYILDNNISEDNKNRIISVSNQYERKQPIWIKAQNINETLSMDVSLDRGSIAQYARLFLSDALPLDLQRVLYLDCDIIVKKSIRELWNIELQGKTIAALKEAFSPAYRRNIDLKKDDLMFNSGVMLIDLEKWREDSVEEKMKLFIKEHQGKIQQGDQGALNAVLSHNTYVLEPRFNAQTYYFDFSYKEILRYRKPQDFYSEADIKRATEDPNIIHFTTSFSNVRPWYEGCTHRYKDEWLKYKAISPWKETDSWGKTNKNMNKTTICRRITIELVGILHAYIRPLIVHIREKWR